MGAAPQAPGTVSLRHADAHLGTAGQVALRAGLGSRRPAGAVPAPPALSVRGGARPGARGDQPARQVAHHRVRIARSEEHTSELQSQSNLVCRLLLEKKKTKN